MQLNKVQDRFKDYILTPKHKGKYPDSEFSSAFIEHGASIADRLYIYRSKVQTTLSDMIIDIFPLLVKLTGEEFVRAMASEYVTKNPPKQGNLNEYATDFDQFVATYKPAQTLTYLPDIAKLEIAWHAAYHAKDDSALKAAELTAIPPEDLADTKIKLRDSAQLIESAYPLPAIKEFCEHPTPENAATPDINAGGCYLLIYRPELQLKMVELTKDSFHALSYLQEGKPLGETVSETLAHHPNFDFQKFLQTQLSLETFSSIAPNK